MQQAVPHELKDIDRQIIRELATDGNNTPANLAERADVSRQWASQRLQQMESADYVTNIGRGVYRLQPESLPDDVREDLRIGYTACEEAREDLKRALEHNEWSAVEDAAARLGVETDG